MMLNDFMIILIYFMSYQQKLVRQCSQKEPRNLFTYTKKSSRPSKIYDPKHTLNHHLQTQSQKSCVPPYTKVNKDEFKTNLTQMQLQMIETTRVEYISKTGYPYSAIGLLKARNKGDIIIGCGCIIDSKIVITCASNLYNHYTQQEYTQEIEFIPSLLLKNDPNISGFKAKGWSLPQKFKDKSNYQEYNYAVIELQIDFNLGQYFGTFGYDLLPTIDDENDQATQYDIIGLQAFAENQVAVCHAKITAIRETNHLIYSLQNSSLLNGSPILQKQGANYNLIGFQIGDTLQKNNLKAGFHLTHFNLQLLQRSFNSYLICYNFRSKGIQGKTIKNIIQEIIKQQSKNVNSQNTIALNFEYNRLESQGCRQLSQSNLKELVSLCLQMNNIQNEGCMHLAKGKWQPLHTLLLQSNNIGPEGMHQLSQAKWQQLLKFSIKRNTIQDLGCKYLSKSAWIHLESVNLGNDIGVRGCRYLCSVPWNNIKQLLIGYNNLGDESCHHISKTQWLKIQKLGINNSHIGDKGCYHLTKKRWPNLKFINLQKNRVGAAGCNYLFQAVWVSLSSINIMQNWIEHYDYNKLDTEGLTLISEHVIRER